MLTIRTSAIAFLAANVVHTLDHLRQGIGGLTAEILTAGSLLTVAAIAVLVLVLRRDARATVLALGVGLSGAAGIAAAHLAPHWSAFSEPYPGAGLDALSWAVMVAELTAAVWLAAAAAAHIQRRRLA